MDKLYNHYLHPAAMYISTAPCMISTVLGSCVSVCLWDSVLEIGGMNHYMLPLWNGQGLASPKYGNIATDKLIEGMINNGSKKKNITAKVFGGASVLQIKNDIFNIGERNIDLAYNHLKINDIKIIAESVGGYAGRKLIFFPHTGEVRQKYLTNGMKICD